MSESFGTRALLEDLERAYAREAEQGAALAKTRSTIVLLLHRLQENGAETVDVARAILRAKGRRPTVANLVAACRAVRERRRRGNRPAPGEPVTT